MTRIAGAERIGTAIAVAQRGWPDGADRALVATALYAAGLAHERIGGTVVGGAEAVSDVVLAQLGRVLDGLPRHPWDGRLLLHAAPGAEHDLRARPGRLMHTLEAYLPPRHCACSPRSSRSSAGRSARWRRPAGPCTSRVAGEPGSPSHAYGKEMLEGVFRALLADLRSRTC